MNKRNFGNVLVCIVINRTKRIHFTTKTMNNFVYIFKKIRIKIKKNIRYNINLSF